MHDRKLPSKSNSTKNTALARRGLMLPKMRSFGTFSSITLGRYRSVFKQQPNEDSKNRALVFGWLLAGTMFVAIVVWLLLLLSYLAIGNEYVISRLAGSTIIVGFLAIIGLLAYGYKKYTAAAWLLIGTYAVIAWTIVWEWGINTPFGILMFALVIVISGILLQARYALYASAASFTALVGLQLLQECGWHTPNDDWTGKASNFGDVFAYATGFLMIAIVSWMYGRQMERSLQKATAAEKALQAQKANLEIIVQQRTAALEQTQLEEMEQMYRLTQVGSLSTGLLHDLANYLTVLTLDIENLRNKQSVHDDTALERAHETISYIDTMVEDVRRQLHGTRSNAKKFNVIEAIDEVVVVLQFKAEQSGVSLEWKAPRTDAAFMITGDRTRFNQVMTTLICNAIDAYPSGAKKPTVWIEAAAQDGKACISVEDTGKGIPPTVRLALFKKLQSSKMSGMGIGLFLAKQIVERHLQGALTLDPSHKKTRFIIEVPTTHGS